MPNDKRTNVIELRPNPSRTLAEIDRDAMEVPVELIRSRIRSELRLLELREAAKALAATGPALRQWVTVAALVNRLIFLESGVAVSAAAPL
jgi:hypothetical protein